MVGDELLRSDGQAMRVGQVEHQTEQSTPVYNVEVADWHTYLVSWWMFIVHNATVCFLNMAKAGVKYAQDILKGQPLQ